MVLRVLVLVICVELTGCGLVPPAVSIATFAADAFSYTVSGKSISDHGLSMAMREDCAVLNFIQGEAICAPGPHPKIEMVPPRDTESERTLLASASGHRDTPSPDREVLRWTPTETGGLSAEYLAAGVLEGSVFASTALTLEPLTSGPVDVIAGGDNGTPPV